MLALASLAALALTAQQGLNRTAQVERVQQENMKTLDKIPQRAQRFPAVAPHVILEDVNSFQRNFDVYMEGPTRTYLGSKGVYTITGYDKK